MQLNDLATKVARLPDSKQQEVLDFVAFLEARYLKDQEVDLANHWTDDQFKLMSVDQAMRGLEEEPDLYSDADLKDRWL